MKIAALCIVTMSLGGLLLACSSDSTTGTGSGSSCTPAEGSYKVHYTKDSSSTGKCVDIPDSTITVKASDGGTGEGTVPAGCTSTTDKAACTNTTKCTQTTSGITIDTNSTTKVSGSGISGTTETTTKGSPAGDSSCKYAFTWTKQ